MAASRDPDPKVLRGVLSRQRLHLLGKLRGLAQLRAPELQDPVADLLLTAAELHVPADVSLVDAAEQADLNWASGALTATTAVTVAHPPTDLGVDGHG
jgi:hypothetical protein